MAALIAIQSQRKDPIEPGPSIDPIPSIATALAIQPASAKAVSVAGRRSVRGNVRRS
jgi:hypothetical protein